MQNRQPERFAAIQDMPEFQNLIAETPLTEADKHSHEANRKREMYAEDLSESHINRSWQSKQMAKSSRALF